MPYIIIYDVSTGEILRNQYKSTAKIIAFEEHLITEPLPPEQGYVELSSNVSDITQKIIDDKVVDKTPEEIEAEKPPKVPKEKLMAFISNEQLQSILDRLETLENQWLFVH